MWKFLQVVHFADEARVGKVVVKTVMYTQARFCYNLLSFHRL